MKMLRNVGMILAFGLVGAQSAPASASAYSGPDLSYRGDLTTPTVVTDSSGNGRHGTILTGGGGTVTSVRERGDSFLRFPGGSCTTAVTVPPTPLHCPQGIVQVPAAEAFTPGEALFSFGAEIRLTQPPSPLAGQNVFQFGAAGAGLSQWKLQVDYGRPSCRWSDGTNVVLLPAGADDYQLTPGTWYRVLCTRVSATLFQTLVLDVRTGRPALTAAHATAPLGPILPTGTVVVGGKRVRDTQSDVDTDQFHGDLDDIFYWKK
jgi:hypothetical protein